MFRFLMVCSLVLFSSAFQSVRFLPRSPLSKFSLNSETLRAKQISSNEEFTKMFRATGDKASLKEKVYLLAARTARGARATKAEKDEAETLVLSLQVLNPTDDPAQASEGSWDLLYTNTNIFRSSPLFMAARAMAKGETSSAFNSFTDLFMSSIKFARIGRVRQDITATSVVSEFELELPIIAGSIMGTLISSADIEAIDGETMTLLTDNVRIKEGSFNIPGFSQLLDSLPGVPVKSIGGLLENIPAYETPRPVFSTTYIDADFRISRDQDQNIFIYTKNHKSFE